MLFQWFRGSPRSRLERRRKAKLKEAHAAMNQLGDRGLHAELMAQAEELQREIDELDQG